jgi:Cu/Ag efflux pump CusA
MQEPQTLGDSLPVEEIDTGRIADVGGRTIAMGEQAVNVRGVGVVSTLEDIGNIVLSQQGGVPVLVSDVAKMQIGFTPRLGIAGPRDGEPIVIRRTGDHVARRSLDFYPAVGRRLAGQEGRNDRPY